MKDAKRLNTILGIVAVLILVLSFSAFAYSIMPKGDAELVVINDVEFSWDSILSDYDMVDFTASDETLSGVSLEQLISDSGVVNPEAQSYRLIGLDGYQKDVTWDDVQNGYLVEQDHKVVFPHMTRSFWVKDLASIEVV